MATQDGPTFSVVIPALDAERTIGLAIDSALAQTRGDLEVVVVDNGSTDDTVGQVASRSDERVRLVHEATRGPSSARNAGVAAARGRYVCFLDSDDVLLPEYLEAMEATLRTDPRAAIAYTDGWVFYESPGRILRRSAMAQWRPRHPPEQPEEFLRELLLRGNFVLISVLIERALFIHAGGFRPELHRAEDWELWLRLSALGHRFAASRRKLVVYRRRVGQLSGEPLQTRQAAMDVCRIVAEEYDVTEDIRTLAQRCAREHETGSPGRSPRRVPRGLRGPYRAVWTLRWFYLRPPRRLRAIYRELRRA